MSSHTTSNPTTNYPTIYPRVQLYDQHSSKELSRQLTKVKILLHSTLLLLQHLHSNNKKLSNQLFNKESPKMSTLMTSSPISYPTMKFSMMSNPMTNYPTVWCKPGWGTLLHQ